MHTTNYYNTFITIADDCTELIASIPPLRGGKKTVAGLQFEMIYENPYTYDSDDVLFGVNAIKKAFEKYELAEQRELFFSKGQPCFRASALGKKFGWGIHCNADGKIAIYAVESAEYQNLIQDEKVKKVKAMKSTR